MTAWRTPLVPQAETTAENGEKDHGITRQPVTAAAIREQPPADNSANPRSLSGAIKQLFRDMKRALTGKQTPAPKPKRRRRRDEDTRGLFKKLAMKFLAPVVRSIFDTDDFNCFTPPDALDETQRLMQRERYGQDAIWQNDHAHASHYEQANHLSPRF